MPQSGQACVASDEVLANHSNDVVEEEADLCSVGVQPKFAIGQRAYLVSTPAGNLLFDSVPILDEATRNAISEMGGISAIALSHPHFYTSMVEWSEAFGRVPIYIHETDREWVVRTGGNFRFWSGVETEILPGRTGSNSSRHLPSAPSGRYQTDWSGRIRIGPF